MKNYLFIASLLFLYLFLSGCAAGDRSTGKAAVEGWCSAGENCTACRNCSQCKNCHLRGGICSVCCPSCFGNPAKSKATPANPTLKPKQKPAPKKKKQVPESEKVWIKP